MDNKVPESAVACLKAEDRSYILRVPRANPALGLPPLELDMTFVYKAEDRLVETEHANVHSANPLSALFNMASNKASIYSKKISYELSCARTLLKKREADLLIDQWPAFMEEKKLNDSAAMRDAFLRKDKMYSDLLDRIDILAAMEAFLKEKKETFVRAYQQMKQLYVSEKRDPTYFQGGNDQ